MNYNPVVALQTRVSGAFRFMASVETIASFFYSISLENQCKNAAVSSSSQKQQIKKLKQTL
jgi:hypothetical protein